MSTAAVYKKNNVTIINENGDQTIIFAHGFGTDQSAWKEVAAAFADKYRLVLYDNVGAGNADPAAFSPNKYDNLQSYADDLLDICHDLDIKNAIVVAHSVSGMITLLAAVKEPERFSKIVMIGASPRYLNDDGYVGGFSQDDLNGLYAAMANNYQAWVSGFAPAAMANAERPQLAQNFASTLSAIRPDIAQSVAKVIFQSDYRSALPNLAVDTLLLQTQRDIAVPMEVAEYLNNNIKISRMQVVNAEGHFPHMSAPDQIITAIKSYI